MAKKKRSDELIKATKFADLLLYQFSGGNLGTKPEIAIKNEVATAGEKRGLLDSLIKLADMKRKDSVDDEGESAFDIIRKNTQKKDKSDGGGKSWGRGNTGTAATEPAESSADEPEPADGELTDSADQNG
jgi:hypothetical protein